jgi:acyl-CoA synthetase (AMP-forming)/AMP-acid ligase II
MATVHAALAQASARGGASSIACITYRDECSSESFTTYSELQSLVAALAGALRRRAFGGRPAKGRRVALLCRNHEAALTYIYATSLLGLVLVPLNFRWAPAEVARALADCGAEVSRLSTPLTATLRIGAPVGPSLPRRGLFQTNNV